jgi:hypothetical protein
MHCRIALAAALSIAFAVLACGSSSSDSTQTGPRTLDLSTQDRSCAADGDCTIIASIQNCSSCCTGGAFRDTASLRKVQSDVVEACRGDQSNCERLCEPMQARCVGGTCEVRSTSADAGAD